MSANDIKRGVADHDAVSFEACFLQKIFNHFLFCVAAAVKRRAGNLVEILIE